VTGSGIERRRPYPGADVELSALTLTVGGGHRGGDTRETVQMLRRGRDAGVTTFDVVEAPDPALAEMLLARAFPDGDPAIVVLSHGSQATPGAVPARGPATRPLGARLSDLSPAAAGVAPSRRFRRLFEVEASEVVGGTVRSRAPGDAGGATGDAPLVVRCRSTDDVERAARRPPPWILSGPFSLLDRTVPTAATRLLGAGAFSWIARDPFSGGRLDASRFAVAPTAGPGAPPRTVRELEVEFEPVARFGFLARPRQRTLAQAALRFVLGSPWVATACVPAPSPERWAEIVGYASSPPLDEEERRRADAVAGPGHPLAPGGGGPR